MSTEKTQYKYVCYKIVYNHKMHILMWIKVFKMHNGESGKIFKNYG